MRVDLGSADSSVPKPATPSYQRLPISPTPLWGWFALAAIVLAGLAIRIPGIGGPIAGYHAFNEAFYVDIARRYLRLGILAPWFASLEPNNPPLYPFLLRLVFSAFGPSILVARALSTAAALATVAAIYALGKRLYGVAAGLGAALIMALAPGSVLVGRNIQIEAMLGLVVALTLLAWVIAADEDSVWWAVAAGAFAGLAVLMKMQGLVIVPAIGAAEVFRTRSLRRLVEPVPLAAVLTFCVVGLPWQVWNLFQPANASALQVKAAELALPGSNFVDMLFAREWFWLLSPALAVVAVFGIVYLIWRHRPADVLVLAALLANIVFYLGYHHHTYYLYSALPFVALAAAALMESVERRGATAVVAVACVAALLIVPFALTELAGKKLGYWTVDQIASAAVEHGVNPADAALAVDPLFRASWGPALRLYGRGMGIVSNPLGPGDVLSSGQRLLTLDSEPRPASQDATPLVRLVDEHVMPVFFGYAVDQSHEALFYFAVDQPRFLKTGPWWRFGFARRTYPLNLWAALLSPSFTERIRANAATQTAAPSGAP
jgi:hypothetical protein